MFKVFQIFTLLGFSITVFGQIESKNITPQEFDKLFKTHEGAILIDLRTPKEFAVARLKKAINVDLMMEGFEDFMVKKFSKNSKLFLYSQSEEDAKNASQYLFEIGYKNIWTLKGGFENWILSSKPYISGSQNFTPQNIYTKEIFQKKIRENKYVIVDFYADWCGPCKKMAPILFDIDNKRDDVTLFKIDSDQNQTLVREYEITDIPTILIFRYGRQTWRTTGITEAKEILDRMQ
jgi:thioredoxin